MKKIFAVIMAIVIMFGVSELQAQKKMSNPQTIGGQLALTIPTGFLGDNVGMGVGVNAQYTIYFSPKFAAYGNIGYHNFLAKDVESADGTSLGYSQSAFMIPIDAGAFYQVGKLGKFLPIIGGEFGMHLSKISTNTENKYFDKANDTTTDIVLSLLGGLLYPMNRDVALRGDLKYALSNNAGGFSINFGLLYKL